MMGVDGQSHQVPPRRNMRGGNVRDLEGRVNPLSAAPKCGRNGGLGAGVLGRAQTLRRPGITAGSSRVQTRVASPGPGG